MVGSEDICLTPDEVKSLRELIAMLATMEERGWDIEKPGCIVVTKELWRDLVLGPAAGLRRVTTRRLGG